MELRKLNWSDCSLVQYLEIQDLLNDEELTSTDFVLEVADLFWPLEEDVDEDLLEKIRSYVSFVFKPCQPRLKQKITTEGREFHLKKFSTLPLSSFIDLDLTLVKNSLEECISPVANILYEGEVSLSTVVDDLFVTDLLGCVVEYIKYRKSVFQKYPNIFDTGEDDEYDDEEEEVQEEIEEDVDMDDEEEIDPAEAWMKTVFGLAGGDITKYPNVIDKPHMLVFNWVTTAESVAAKSGRQPSTE